MQGGRVGWISGSNWRRRRICTWPTGRRTSETQCQWGQESGPTGRQLLVVPGSGRVGWGCPNLRQGAMTVRRVGAMRVFASGDRQKASGQPRRDPAWPIVGVALMRVYLVPLAGFGVLGAVMPHPPTSGGRR
jgi:hypothetical protein